MHHTTRTTNHQEGSFSPPRLITPCHVLPPGEHRQRNSTTAAAACTSSRAAPISSRPITVPPQRKRSGLFSSHRFPLRFNSQNQRLPASCLFACTTNPTPTNTSCTLVGAHYNSYISGNHVRHHYLFQISPVTNPNCTTGLGLDLKRPFSSPFAIPLYPSNTALHSLLHTFLPDLPPRKTNERSSPFGKLNKNSSPPSKII